MFPECTQHVAMDTVSAHAASIAQTFRGFQSGIKTVRRDNSDRRVAILTVFNRVVNEDSGLRVKILIPVALTDLVDGRVNLLGNAAQALAKSEEIVIDKHHYTRPFTVSDVCNGMLFAQDTVLAGHKCCIPAGAFSTEMVGRYILPYYVTQLRIMYCTTDDSDSVYDSHAPIFENICGFFATGMRTEHQDVVSAHGNVSFKACNAFFKGVRDVSAIQVGGRLAPSSRGSHRCSPADPPTHRAQMVVTQVLQPEAELIPYVSMAVVTGCLGKSSLVSQP
jgi:hypothetical protein